VPLVLVIDDVSLIEIPVLVSSFFCKIGQVELVTSFLVVGCNLDYSEQFLKQSRKLILMLRTQVGSNPNSKQGSRQDKLKTYQQDRTL
jgi:hypothetical protein